MTGPIASNRMERSAILRLYVAGATPNSVRAQQNFSAAFAASPSAADRFAVEIVDVFVEPRKAMKDGVLVTPTLIALRDGARTVIVGDLADPSPLRALLAEEPAQLS